MRSRSLAGCALVLLMIASPTVHAQTTGLPIFMAPYRAFTNSEIGATFADPGRGYGLEGFYRIGRNAFDIGFRAGFQTSTQRIPLGIPGGGVGNDRTTRLLTGVEIRTRVIQHSEDFPLDGAFTLGVGGALGDGRSVGFVPIGLSLGRRFEFEDSETSFVPYAHPVITPTFGDASDVLFTLGFGVDVRVGRQVDLRVSAGIGDQDGVSVGVSFLR